MGAGASASEPSSEEEALAAGYSPETIVEYRWAKLVSMGFEAEAITRALREQPNDEAALSWLLENPSTTKAETKTDHDDDGGYYDDYKSLYQISGKNDRRARAHDTAVISTPALIDQASREGLAHSGTSSPETSLPQQIESMVHESAAALQAELVAMGFSASAAILALIETSYDLNSALSWLMAQAGAEETSNQHASSPSVAASDSCRHTAPPERSSVERQQETVPANPDAVIHSEASPIETNDDVALATALSASEAESKVDWNTQTHADATSAPERNRATFNSLDIQDLILNYLRSNTGGKPIEESTLRMRIFAEPGISPSAQWVDFDAALEALVLDRAVVVFKASADSNKNNNDDTYSGNSNSSCHKDITGRTIDWVQLAAAATDANPKSDNSTSSRDEIGVQGVIAESILAAHDEGRLTPTDEAMVPWAKGMRQLQQVLASQKKALESDASDGLGTALAESLNPQVKAIEAQLSVERLKVDLAVCHALEAENDDLRLRLEREVAVPASSKYHSSSSSNDLNKSEPMNGLNSNSNYTSSNGMVSEEASAKVDVSAMLALLFRRAEELKEEMHTARKPALAFLQRPHSVGHKHYEEVYLFLKDLVHSRADLAAQRFAIHRYIVDRVGEDVSQAILPLMLALMAKEDEAVIVAREIRRLLALQGHGSFDGLEGKEDESSRSLSQSKPPNSRFSAGDYAADDFDLSVLSALEDETAEVGSSLALRPLQNEAASNSLVPLCSALVVSDSEASSPSRGGISLRDALASLQAVTEARERALTEAAAYVSAKLGLNLPESSALRRGFLAGEAKMHRWRVLRLRENYEAGSGGAFHSSLSGQAAASLSDRADDEEVASLQLALRDEHARQKGALNDALRNERDNRRARLMVHLNAQYSSSVISSNSTSSEDIHSARTTALGEVSKLDSSCDTYAATALALPTLKLYATLAAVGFSNGSSSSSFIESSNNEDQITTSADADLNTSDSTGADRDATILQQSARDLALKVVKLWRAHTAETGALDGMLRHELGRQRSVVCSSGATAAVTNRIDSLELETAIVVVPESAPLFLSHEGNALLERLESAFDSRCAAPREALALVHVHEFEHLIGQNQVTLSNATSSHYGGWKEAVHLLREAQSNEVAALTATLDSIGDEARGRLSEEVAEKRRDRTQRLLALTRQGEEDAVDDSFKSGDDADSAAETALEKQLALSAHFATSEAEEAAELEQQLALQADAAMSQLAHFHGACLKSLAQAAELGLRDRERSSHEIVLWSADCSALVSRASATRELQVEIESVRRKALPQLANAPDSAKDSTIMHYADAKSLLISHKAAREAKEEKEQTRAHLSCAAEDTPFAEIEADTKALEIEADNLPLIISSNDAESKSTALALSSSRSYDELLALSETKIDAQLQLVDESNNKPLLALKEGEDALETSSMRCEAGDTPYLLNDAEAKSGILSIEPRRADSADDSEDLSKVTLYSPGDDEKISSGDEKTVSSFADGAVVDYLQILGKNNRLGESYVKENESVLEHHGVEEKEFSNSNRQESINDVVISTASLTNDLATNDSLSKPPLRAAGNEMHPRKSSPSLSDLPPINGRALSPLNHKNLNQDADAIGLILGMWPSSVQDGGKHSTRFKSGQRNDDSSQTSKGRRAHRSKKEHRKSTHSKRKQKHLRGQNSSSGSIHLDGSVSDPEYKTSTLNSRDNLAETEGKHYDEEDGFQEIQVPREEWNDGSNGHRIVNVHGSGKPDFEASQRVGGHRSSRAHVTTHHGDSGEDGLWGSEDTIDFSSSQRERGGSEHKRDSAPAVTNAKVIDARRCNATPTVEEIDTGSAEPDNDWVEEEVEVEVEEEVDEEVELDEDEDADESSVSAATKSKLQGSASLHGASHATTAEDVSVGREWANAMALQRVEDNLAAMTNQSWRNLEVKKKQSNMSATTRGKATVTVTKGGFQDSAHDEDDEDWSAWDDNDVGCEVGNSVTDQERVGSDQNGRNTNLFKEEMVETTILAPKTQRPNLAPLKTRGSISRGAAYAENALNQASNDDDANSSEYKCTEEMEEIEDDDKSARSMNSSESGIGSMAAEVARIAAFHESEASKLNMCYQVQQARQGLDLADGFGRTTSMNLSKKSAWNDESKAEGRGEQDSEDEVEDSFFGRAMTRRRSSGDGSGSGTSAFLSPSPPPPSLPSFGVNSTSLRFLQSRKWANEVQQPTRRAQPVGHFSNSSGGGGGAASDSSSQRKGTTRVGSFTIQRD